MAAARATSCTMPCTSAQAVKTREEVALIRAVLLGSQVRRRDTRNGCLWPHLPLTWPRPRSTPTRVEPSKPSWSAATMPP